MYFIGIENDSFFRSHFGSSHLAQGVFAQMCVAPFVAWRPRSRPQRSTPDIDRANFDGCGALLLAATASQRAGDPDCFVCSGTHDGHCDGLWWRCVAHSALPQRSRSASHRPSFGFGWPWSHRESEQEFPSVTTAERKSVRDVKEKPCYFCLDFDTEHKSTAEMDKEKTCEPPDENSITVGAKHFRFVKVLVQPSSSGKESSGFHDTSFRNIMKCAVDIRKVERECRVVTWHQPFPRDCGAHDEGIDRVSSIHDEIHGGCSTRVKVFPQHAHRVRFFPFSRGRSCRQRDCCSAFASRHWHCAAFLVSCIIVLKKGNDSFLRHVQFQSGFHVMAVNWDLP